MTETEIHKKIRQTVLELLKGIPKEHHAFAMLTMFTLVGSGILSLLGEVIFHKNVEIIENLVDEAKLKTDDEPQGTFH